MTTVEASDADGSDTLSYSLTTEGADDALFELDSVTGELTFISMPDAETPTDAEPDGIYEVQVQACDDGVPVLCDVQALTITVGDVNEAPVITSNGGIVALR